MAHFTYLGPDQMDRTSLCQGDILCKTDDLVQMLSEVHPYFIRENYRYFMVLTQSCDLVRRDGISCKSPYITLAAVRSLDDFLEKEIKKNNDSQEISKLIVINEKKFNKYLQLIERLYNNNESDYFFLYNDNTLDFPESMVAFLKVSIAIKSQDHYEKCLEAKQLELAEEFKAKLGWLVGNIYSRVGTKDWTEKDESTRMQMYSDELRKRYFFTDGKRIEKLKVAAKGQVFDSFEAAADFVNSIQFESNYDRFLKTMNTIINKYNGFSSQEEKDKFFKKIQNTSILNQLIKK